MPNTFSQRIWSTKVNNQYNGKYEGFFVAVHMVGLQGVNSSLCLDLMKAPRLEGVGSKGFCDASPPWLPLF